MKKYYRNVIDEPKMKLVISTFIFLLLSIVPEVASLLIMIFLLDFLRKKLKPPNLFIYAVACFALTKLMTAISSSKAILILDFLYLFLLGFSVYYWKETSKNQNFKSFYIILGIVIHIAIIVVTWSNSFQQFNWIVDSDFAKIKNSEGIIRVEANSSNSWVNQKLGLQGSGRFEYEVEIRAVKEFDLAIWIQSNSLGQPLQPTFCRASTIWTKCVFPFSLPKRESAQSVLGTFGTLNTNSSILEIRDGKLRTLSGPMWYEYILPAERVKGLAFNENAFGAWIVIVALIGSVFAVSYLGFFVTLALPLLPILWSSSRNALLAYVAANLLLFFAKFLAPKFKQGQFFLTIYLIGVIFGLILGIIFFRSDVPVTTSSFQASRIVIPSYDLSVRGRVQLWRLTLSVWLESPKSFLFGVGDLTTALRANLDALAVVNGLSKDKITHAHNLWVQTLGETGLVGLLLLCFGWGFAIVRAWRDQDWGAISIFLCVFILNSFDYLFYYAPVQLVFWMAVVGFKQMPDIVKSQKTLTASTS